MIKLWTGHHKVGIKDVCPWYFYSRLNDQKVTLPLHNVSISYSLKTARILSVKGNNLYVRYWQHRHNLLIIKYIKYLNSRLNEVGKFNRQFQPNASFTLRKHNRLTGVGCTNKWLSTSKKQPMVKVIFLFQSSANIFQ